MHVDDTERLLPARNEEGALLLHGSDVELCFLASLAVLLNDLGLLNEREKLLSYPLDNIPVSKDVKQNPHEASIRVACGCAELEELDASDILGRETDATEGCCSSAYERGNGVVLIVLRSVIACRRSLYFLTALPGLRLGEARIRRRDECCGSIFEDPIRCQQQLLTTGI